MKYILFALAGVLSTPVHAYNLVCQEVHVMPSLAPARQPHNWITYGQKTRVFAIAARYWWFRARELNLHTTSYPLGGSLARGDRLFNNVTVTPNVMAKVIEKHSISPEQLGEILRSLQNLVPTEERDDRFKVEAIYEGQVYDLHFATSSRRLYLVTAFSTGSSEGITNER